MRLRQAEIDILYAAADWLETNKNHREGWVGLLGHADTLWVKAYNSNIRRLEKRGLLCRKEEKVGPYTHVYHKVNVSQLIYYLAREQKKQAWTVIMKRADIRGNGEEWHWRRMDGSNTRNLTEAAAQRLALRVSQKLTDYIFMAVTEWRADRICL